MLDWLYTAISWVMARWHSLWTVVFGSVIMKKMKSWYIGPVIGAISAP